MRDVFIVSPEMVAIQWKYTNQFAPHDIQTNVFLATFTTCYARLKLYDLLDNLKERVLYFDTDSIVFMTEEGRDPSLGDYLGELTDELDGEVIKVFVSGNISFL